MRAAITRTSLLAAIAVAVAIAVVFDAGTGPDPAWSAEATETAPQAESGHAQDRDSSVSLGNLADAQPTNRRERVDVDGEVDYFHFWLSHQRVVRLRIRRLDYNADLYLENQQGTVIASRESAGDRKEVLNVTLAPAGADEPYYIRIEASEDGRND